MKKKQVITDIEFEMVGKPTPQALELETAVLGACMLEKDAFMEVSEILKPEFFYQEFHQDTFQAMIELSFKSQPIDILTVREQMAKHADKYPSLAYDLSRMTNAVVSSANIVSHARIILQKWSLRSQITLGYRIIASAYEFGADSFEVQDLIEAGAASISDSVELGVITDYTTLAMRRGVEIVQNDGTKPLGPLTGFPSIDKILVYFQPFLYIIGARPSMGKTSWLINVLDNITQGIRGYMEPMAAGVIEIETSSGSFLDRHYALKTGINSARLKKGGLDETERKKVYHALQEINNQKIYAQFMSDINLTKLRSLIRKWIKKFGVKIIFIDYLQLIKPTENDERRNNRERNVTLIGEGLAAIAKDLNIPIVALAQLSRAAAQRAKKEPELSDLREGGGLEASARFVAFLHRDNYYGITKDEDGNLLPPNRSRFLIKKHNDGELDDINLTFIGQESRYVEEEPPFAAVGGWTTIES